MQNIWKNTRLHTAVFTQNLDTVKLEIQNHRKIIDQTDQFPSSLSTPLLIACKIANSQIALLLIAENANVQKSDVHGFTPLHYACIYRLNKVIIALINKGASVTKKNKFKKTAYDYYFMSIKKEDLEYKYGSDSTNKEILKTVYDWDSSYQGTKKADFSALRWFIHHVVANYQMDKPDEIEKFVYRAVWNKSFYMELMKKFVDIRVTRYTQITSFLLIRKQAEYLHDEYQKRLLSTFHGFITKNHLRYKSEKIQQILAFISDDSSPALLIGKTDGRTQHLLHQVRYDKYRRVVVEVDQKDKIKFKRCYF